jgi:predicted transcriptional regulator of viral defense system
VIGAVKYYERLLRMGCFTWDELCGLTGNRNTANTLAQNYQKKGYIRSIRRGLYVAVNLADKGPAVSKFRIAGKITPSAYVSHHAAFEYYGCANQVSYQTEVSSGTAFASFQFDGITYAYLQSRIPDGVIMGDDGIRVTDLERTVLDNIHDFDKVMGIEELLNGLDAIPSLREDKLLAYLAAYDKQVLYQKAGYILEHFNHRLRLSENFFGHCLARIGNSRRYLYAEPAHEYLKYNGKWRLMVPGNLMYIISQGVDEAAEI